MEPDNVIFLIESKTFNKDLMRISLEKMTNFKVFNFFSIDEASMYQSLKPRAILYTADNNENIADYNFSEQISFINISNKINQEGKSFLLKHTNIAERLFSMLQ